MYQEHQHDAQERTRPYNGQQTGRVFLHQFKHGGYLGGWSSSLLSPACSGSESRL